MPDEVDRSQKQQEEDLERRIAAARGEIRPGKPGDCDLCGEYSGRLIGGVCAPCRDKYKLA